MVSVGMIRRKDEYTVILLDSYRDSIVKKVHVRYICELKTIFWYSLAIPLGIRQFVGVSKAIKLVLDLIIDTWDEEIIISHEITYRIMELTRQVGFA